MLQFTDTDQQYPDVADAARRKLNDREIYANFDPKTAAVQAARCSQCGIPFCQVHCPLGNNIPDWLRLTAEGRLQEAYETAAATNTFPEICGRICPQDRLCEGNCVIEPGFGAVTIGSIEKYITETAFQNDWVKPVKPARETGHSIGIIGAGPAGLAAAEALRRQGHRVHVYDRYDRTGGLLIYGIPSFKLEKHVVQRRHDWLVESGITFHHNSDIGGTLPFDELRSRHDALLIATGVYKPRELRAPGNVLGNIIEALPYLTASNRLSLGDKISKDDATQYNAKGKKVVVIGGGDTAMDCVRTAVRQGATSVTCLYRRDRANMPGSAREVKNAEEEGVIFQWLGEPAAFTGKGNVQHITVQQMRLLPAGRDGRQSTVPIEGDTYELAADLVIKALGFDAEDLPALWNTPGLTLTERGTITADARTLMTPLPGVFAAGDIVRGASLVVWAIRDGRDAAAAIHRYLKEQALAA